jgi:hypothetical protein
MIALIIKRLSLFPNIKVRYIRGSKIDEGGKER